MIRRRVLFSGLHAVGQSLAQVNADSGTYDAQHKGRHDSDRPTNSPADPASNRRADEAKEFLQFATAFFGPRPEGLPFSISSMSVGFAGSGVLFGAGISAMLNT